MGLVWTVSLSMLLSSTPETQSRLEALLQTLGQRELEREARTCRVLERTVVEELDGDGEVKGKVIREYTVTHDRTGPRRTLKSETFEGDPSGMFRQRPKEEKPEPSPFHPKAQALYRFELEVKPGATTGTLRFTPKKLHERRMKGTAHVDLTSSHILSMKIEPSDYPMGLDALTMNVTLADTACGRQPVRVTTEGEGGILFLRVRFRSDTSLSGHSST